MDQVHDFIFQCKSAGLTENQIKEKLLQNGWTTDQIAPLFPPSSISPKKFPAKPLIFILFLVILSIPVSIYVYSILQTKTDSPVSPLPAQNTPTPESNPIQSLKTFTLQAISFKYPSDWGDAEYVTTSYGQSAEIKNSDSTGRIIVHSGVNKDNSESELKEFLDFIVSAGGELLTLDGSAAVKGPSSIDNTGITIIINAPDKASQYTITIQKDPGLQTDELINTILSSFKFITP